MLYAASRSGKQSGGCRSILSNAGFTLTWNDARSRASLGPITLVNFSTVVQRSQVQGHPTYDDRTGHTLRTDKATGLSSPGQVQLYGERFDLISDPFRVGNNCVLVDALEQRSQRESPYRHRVERVIARMLAKRRLQPRRFVGCTDPEDESYD